MTNILKIMKKNILTIILLSFIPFFNSNADNKNKKEIAKAEISFTMSEEVEVNDIPFNTAEIAAAYFKNISFSGPSDTNLMQSELMLKSIDRRNFNLEDEEEVDDIPFSTELIAGNGLIENTPYSLKEEKEYNDIPFDTYKIANEIMESKK